MTKTIVGRLGFECSECDTVFLFDLDWARLHAETQTYLQCPRGHSFQLPPLDVWPTEAPAGINWTALVGGVLGAAMLWAVIFIVGRWLWTLVNAVQ